MRQRIARLLTVAFVVFPAVALAVGPTVTFTLPAEDTTPSVWGSLPYPNDLYFDQGEPGDGDGTLVNSGASIGLGVDVIRSNTASAEDAIDLLDGFGTTSAIFFFLSGPLDTASLPASPVTAPALTDSVFCADAATATPVPIALRFNIDTRIPNVLAVLPLPGRPLKATTRYTCVIRTSVTGGGDPVEPSADWVSVRDGASANTDADSIFDGVVAVLGGAGVPAAQIAGMTVFTTQQTSSDLSKIRDVVLPSLPVPTADLTSRPELVFDTPAELFNLLGRNPTAVATIATGYYDSAQFQTPDPDGDFSLNDLPNPPSFVNCSIPCETDDERFTRDGLGNPIVVSVPEVPFTVVIPSGTPPVGGWPVIIQQHGLGGQRDTVVAFGEADAAAGFASIGIDAQAHGYRFFFCGPSAVCSQDTANNFGGTAIPDGIADGNIAGFSVSFLTVNLGFFQGFHNFLGIRDNFRQTYADLLSLVRLIKGHSVDAALGTSLNDQKIFYMGHSLGGLMGSGFVPIEPSLKASLLNATGGGLTNQLFINSSIGGGAQALVNGILGLDPANVPDQFAFQPNIVQSIIDPADGLNSAALLLDPDAGAPRNVIQVEDFGDQVVPNQANEALALAAGLPLFDPFVQNLHQSALSLPVVSTPFTVSANVAGGLATAALLQNGPATHAASIGTGTGTLTFVPEFAHSDDFVATGNGFPLLERGINVPNAGILDEVLAWFRDVADNGPPGTFNFSGLSLAELPNFNPIQNIDVPLGTSDQTFFERTVGGSGGITFPEPTPDVRLHLFFNNTATRFTAGRSILGTDPRGTDRDMPPAPFITVGTPGVLPFFVTLQRGPVLSPFNTDIFVTYTSTELTRAGIPSGSPSEAALKIGQLVAGTCAVGAASCVENGDCGANGPCQGVTYTILPTFTTGFHELNTNLPTFDGETFAILNPNVLTGGPVLPLIPGGGSGRTDCHSEWQVQNATNTPFLRRGLVSTTQTCTDGDPDCDIDGDADGTCTFHVSVCFNQTDPSLPACTAQTTASVHVTLGSKPQTVANADALLEALEDLGGTRTGARLDDVDFAPPLSAGICTAFISAQVAAGKKENLRTRIISPNGQKDRDRIRLVCNP
jgi:hypothetical protein